MSTERFINEWTDVGANFLRTGGWVDSSGAIVSLQAAMAAASNAQLDFSTVAVPFMSSIAPVLAIYPTVGDVAVFNFVTGLGGGLQLVVPAPIAALFAPDSVTIDPTAAASVAIITAAIGTLSDAGGSLVTAYTSGVKSSRRKDVP
jgi:hypothetical protein